MMKQNRSEISVLTFNILCGGTHLGQPLEQTAAVVDCARADIVVLCEQMGSAHWLADKLGFYCHEVLAPPYWNSVAVLSRFTIIEKFNNGVRIEISTDNTLCIFGVHLTSSPYQPYSVRDKISVRIEDLIEDANRTRGHELDNVLNEIVSLIEAQERVLLCGDFNEPSHLDWTERSGAAGQHFDQTILWPCSQKVIASGMEDAVRTVCPDEVNYPGLTWTPVPGLGVGGSESKDAEVHDRIDFIYHAGPRLRPFATELIGESADEASLIVSPYPSDHRAVVVRFELK